MGRPKGYDRDVVLVAARDLFWERGYEGAVISELEQRTGLNRSSLYQEFGSKRELFEAALECYIDQVIARLLAGLDESDAALDALTTFFQHLGGLFQSGAPVAARGCLLVNSIAAVDPDEISIRPAGSAYRERLRSTFAHALANAARRGEVDPDTVTRRAQLLASTLMGIWLAVRIDPHDAAGLCRAAAAEIRSWRLPPAPDPPGHGDQR